MKAIILAGGFGLRLRPLTDDKPKAMVPVNGKPIAEFQLSWLKQNIRLEQVTFACGHKWERLKEYFGSEYDNIPIDYMVEDQPLGTGGAVKNVIHSINIGDEDVLVMNGDVITNMLLSRIVDWHISSQTIVTMLLVPYRSPFGVVHIDKLRTVRKFEEKPEFPNIWINGGIYIIQAKRLMPFLPEKGDIERETFPKLVQYGEISAYPFYGMWRAIDSIKDLKEIEAELASIELKPSQP
ncbi:MAG: nucleotidyltransferase family protein [archaeon]|nr:nucleotidyltransferase family protein [archaeon]MCP8314439.1 nucleotidyltransferase family protein [archaeon]MCP8317208.1 nucleotidyltransferase family protein [archaeon]MCP8319355.1 nucleotidyltransferase family protein [archaeon]